MKKYVFAVSSYNESKWIQGEDVKQLVRIFTLEADAEAYRALYQKDADVFAEDDERDQTEYLLEQWELE